MFRISFFFVEKALPMASVDVPISPNGEILLRRYTRRDGTRSFTHDVV
jgi:hypothetical protein